MDSNPPIRLGHWTDHTWSDAVDSTTHLLTVTATCGTIWKLSLGVALGLSWPCAKSIMIRCWAWMLQIKQNPRNGSTLQTEQQPLLHGIFAELSGESEVAATNAQPDLHVSSASDDSVAEEQARPPGSSEQPGNSQRWPEVVVAILIATMGVVYAFAGGAVGELPANTIGLSNNEDCGFWELKRNADGRIQDNDDLVQAEKEMRAARYAKHCYGDAQAGQSTGCDIFQDAEIAHSLEKVDCPFSCPNPDNCICANGIYNSAVRLDTGSFRVDKLGLNAASLPLVRRTSTFVPLNIDYGFVVDKSGSDDDFEFEYYLGPINDTAGFRNFTFSMHGLPFNWDISAYALFPIGRPVPKYYNSDPRPRVLVAIDEMRVCANDETVCDSPEELPKGISLEMRSAYEMARTVFKRTSTYNSLRYRRGSALMAADGISDYESRQLSEGQWIIESQALFRTSLARLKFNARDFSTSNRPRGPYTDAYNNTTPDWARRENCVPYKFPLPGQYANVRVADFCFLLIPIALFVGSRQVAYPKKDLPFAGSWMVFDSIFYYIFAAAYRVGLAFGALWQVTKGKVSELVGMNF
ncbi:hypothetical protein PG996_007425 [Apiospora saccharicola]|uniref:Uncharacterized protein n=1 Tax=Apiospora saccharicola TaxID=335842 RepID=A0ABR1VEG2_9PEZI